MLKLTTPDDCTQTIIPLPENLRSEVPLIVDDFSLAMRLGIKCKTLWWLIHEKKNLYTVFHIPKATGGKRTIFAPNIRLKYVQQKVHERILKPLPVLSCVGAYTPGKSCLDSAKQHSGKPVVITIDLKNFFPAHTRGRVLDFFRDAVGYSQYVSGLLADLLTAYNGHKHIVPQGSPASPTLCNLIAQNHLDGAILQFVEPLGWTYTRYADDLTLSHPDDVPRPEVDALLKTLQQLIKDAGYRINWKKLKVQRSYRQQKVLGIVVNERPTILRHEYRRYRAILSNCKRDGFPANAIRYGMTSTDEFFAHLRGKLSYFKSIDPIRGERLLAMFKEALNESS